MRRIGVTCRVVEARDYRERRDALAQDWQRFLAVALPGAPWMPLPNLAGAIVEHVRAWGLDGFVLSGGDAPGECPRRDQTERALLDLAVANRFPVFGVCRGAQVVNAYFGGALSPCPDQGHVATRHAVLLTDGQRRQVNSFHAFCLRSEDLAGPLLPLAYSPEGDTEAFTHNDLPILGVMWHPEREATPAPQDVRMLRSLFLETAL